jgi:thymidylate synthase
MYVNEKTLDDLLKRVLEEILSSGTRVTASKGSTTEIFGILLELGQPLARLSRSEDRGRFFSALGEFLWHVAGSNELSFIQYYVPDYGKYSDDKKTLWGAYGPRIFGMRDINQYAQIRDLLKRKATSRQAVVQIFNAEDLVEEHKDVPCTCTLQFLMRDGCLHLYVNMRSNDAYIGLPHDVFVFTMFQELLARELDVEVGRYKHAVGSLHLYDEHLDGAKRFVDEGWQSTALMPPMPQGNPWPSVEVLTGVESALRRKQVVDVMSLPIDSYWSDIAKALKIYALTRGIPDIGSLREVVALRKCMASDFFNQYIGRREKRAAH